MKRVFAWAAIAVALTACGSSGRGVPPSASAELHADVQQLRAAAIAGDTATATGKLAELRAQVETLRGQGQLTDTAAHRILAAANDVEHNLGLIPTTTTTVTTSTTPPKHKKGDGKDGGDEGGDQGGD